MESFLFCVKKSTNTFRVNSCPLMFISYAFQYKVHQFLVLLCLFLSSEKENMFSEKSVTA